ncbi:MAG: AbrB/MazE/SpoVT family DNA-binding domain-containing protein [Chloroflexota bacterium]
MSQTISKWGNSLAYRIPKPFADELGWTEDTAVTARVVDGHLLIEAVVGPEYTLDELLAGIKPENIHGETGTGPAVGNEA